MKDLDQGLRVELVNKKTFSRITIILEEKRKESE